MQVDYILTSLSFGETPTILPDVPGEKIGHKSRRAWYRAISAKHPVVSSGVRPHSEQQMEVLF